MSECNILNFHEMGLDDRILKAIAKLGWLEPTLIQERAIPLILQNKDVLVRARTGSGKTGAFAIPMIQKIINLKQTAQVQETKALVLSPSKELCNQLHKNIQELTMKCSRDVKCVDISEQVDVSVQEPLLVERPDIVVATPARALAHLKAKTLDLKSSLEIVIIDEADLVFSFGYEDDMKAVLKFLPKLYQAILASATLSEDVLSLKHLILRNPVILKLEEPAIAPVSQLAHYHILAQEDEKATILYTLLKLNLVQGKTIIFVNTVDKCYKLKLYLEQFKISTCVLNSELPAKARCHAVYQFNQGLYDVIIASDEKALETPQINSTNNRKRKRDKESGVSRGIDFQFVSNVINFDFPLDIQCYIHRAGRTARGKNQGTALSFVSLREQDLMNDVNEYLMTNLHEDDFIIKPYQFNLDEVKGFEYRAKDAWRSVLHIEIYPSNNSRIPQNYFEDNPTDLETLRHDKALYTVRIQSHLADVPDYIVPPALKKLARIEDDGDEDVRAEPITDEEYNKQYEEYKKRSKSMSERGEERWARNFNE
ncbi:probable ATP-dependent RNA helicase DDX56 [Diaphorina citri]|uniref:RNA helicase n=1 Tax=Diaphorina citri TaxID=121845 RepID=A0A1S3DBJ3_DIACI|nr:probable ATP-dependent RNA helicase DDX56 [Diaphorina citri]